MSNLTNSRKFSDRTHCQQPTIYVEHLARTLKYLAAISQIPIKHPTFLLINSHQQVDCALKERSFFIKKKGCFLCYAVVNLFQQGKDPKQQLKEFTICIAKRFIWFFTRARFNQQSKYIHLKTQKQCTFK